MKILLMVILVVGAVATQAAIMTAAEQYRVLKTTKQTEDANAERQFKESISVIEADRDLSIYKGYLKLHRERGLEKRLLKFTGTVTQKVNVVLGKNQLVLQVRGAKDIFDVTATFKDKIPERIKVGDRVTVSGTFEKGNLVGATIVKSTVVPVL